MTRLAAGGACALALLVFLLAGLWVLNLPTPVDLVLMIVALALAVVVLGASVLGHGARKE